MKNLRIQNGLTIISKEVDMYRVFLVFYAACLMAAVSLAQTPVGSLVVKYENVKGAQDFTARGGKMNFIRGFIRKTPVGPIADNIDELLILKLAKASSQYKNSFIADLKAALKDYEYCGKESYDNDMFEIYILRSEAEVVKDLVIYNPDACSINSLQGTIPVSELEKLATSYGK